MSDLQSKVVHLDNAVHHGPERDLNDISLILMHGTAGDSAMSSIEYLNTTTDKSASYGYVIDRDGMMYRMCKPEIIAYHAGDSAWPSPTRYPPGNRGLSVNSISIGIAWANLEDGQEQLTDEQLESGLWLCRYWMDKLDIRPSRVIGHKECSPGRKTDPRAIGMGEWRQSLAEYQP